MDIFDFNTRQTANALGSAVSEISSQVFRQIEVAIKNYERSKQAKGAKTMMNEMTYSQVGDCRFQISP